ncbi:MAG: 3-oxoacyl-[acyl-carrier protein] reductase [Porticoccaceae bacterium]|jgi:3-oxoacyl-[acyl-carrier protein] reductase
MSAFLIFGATGSVGSRLARRLVKNDCNVVLAGRDSEKLAAISSELGCPSATVDASDAKSFVRCFEETIGTFGQIAGVANCIGSLLLKPAHRTTDDEFQATLTTNLFSAFATVRAAGQMMNRNGGSVVLVSSAAARIGMPNHEAIAAAKAGIEGLTISAAASYAARGIRFNAVAPGLTKSNMTRHLWENTTAAEASTRMHALGRLGEPEDVAAMIHWLLSNETSWVTGQVFAVDGGLSSVLGRPKVSR